MDAATVVHKVWGKPDPTATRLRQRSLDLIEVQSETSGSGDAEDCTREFTVTDWFEDAGDVGAHDLKAGAVEVAGVAASAGAASSMASSVAEAPGSRGHAEGTCRPCRYAGTTGGCANGADCDFCHLEHGQRVHPRPCKQKRAQCKRLAGMLDQLLAQDPCSLPEALELLSSRGGYLEEVVHRKMRQLEASGCALPPPGPAKLRAGDPPSSTDLPGGRGEEAAGAADDFTPWQ